MSDFGTNRVVFLAWLMQLVTGIAALTFQQCGSSRSRGDQSFAIRDCPASQVISIQSAEVGFNLRWSPRSRRSRCSQRDVTCRMSTRHPDIMNCNGQRTCSISQSVLRYPQGNVQRLCSRHYDANFILIRYQCIEVMKSETTTARLTVATSSTPSPSNYSSTHIAGAEPMYTPDQRHGLHVTFRTLSTGEFVGLIIGAGLLLLTLISFLVVIIICMQKHGRLKRKSKRDASTCTEPQQQPYYNLGGIQRPRGDEVTSQNTYQTLQPRQLQLNNAVAAYLELLPPGGRH